MLSFKPLTLEHIPLVRPFLKNDRLRQSGGGLPCDSSIGGIFMWRDFFGTEYAIENDMIFFQIKRLGANTFPVPMGRNLPAALDVLWRYCAENGGKMTLCSVTERDLPAIGQGFDFTSTSERNWAEYLYNAEDIVTLAGRRYSGQRNHINAFKKTHPDYGFFEITADKIPQVLKFYERFTALEQKDSAVFREDQRKVYELLERYDDYGLAGGALEYGGEVLAFALGEYVGDTLFVHAEKADFTIRGTYQMIVNEFAKRFAGENVAFINREDDAGDLGLRTSKLSYHPCRLIEKHLVVINGRK
jgi:hypothetical protein